MSSWVGIAILVACLALARTDPVSASDATAEKVSEAVPADGPTVSRDAFAVNETEIVRDFNATATGNSSLVLGETADGNGNGTLVLGSKAANNARKTVVKDDVATCYVCDSSTDKDKCLKEDTLKTEKCSMDNVCHYIVGEVVENQRDKETVILLGCGRAPAYKLRQLPYGAVTHTASGHDTECRDFKYIHKDMDNAPAGSVYADLDIVFKGHSCSCRGNTDPKCNIDYRKILRPLSSASQSALSVGLLTATLSWTAVMTKLF
ncbi:hypothetical protein BV898_01495 [Hypsibius exemplaris]|uniref:Uncharacterized protein n=1 Tax=Hypsibius exemplaris TaxID=2072580 RepID=A0A1W0XAX4_HYPEX|nr:hypothetical protein BV898_01495 [Hypsibius exemplaris]